MPRTSAKKQPEKIYAQIGEAVGLLGLRLLLAYEFFDAGLEKLHGKNWFGSIQDQFPFPFSQFSADLNWNLAMYAELVFPVLLLVGLLTRLSALALIVLTAVAWYAVHAGYGYTISEGGYKLALMFIMMLLPLLGQGAGKLSLDYLWQRYRGKA